MRRRQSMAGAPQPMRAVGVSVILVLLGLTGVAARPEAASACVGRALDFADAIPFADGAIYGGRITRADIADSFWIDLTIDVDVVVRGPAVTRIRRAQAGHVCDGIRVGEYGFMVRGVREPEFPGPDLNDLFFRVSRSHAEAALAAAGLPNTSTVPGRATPASWTLSLPLLAFSFALAFAFAFRGLQREQSRTGSRR